MKRLLTLSILATCFVLANSQAKYITKNGFVSFYSHTPIEDIKAENNQLSSILDSKSGEVVFNILMKSFHFERALMEEHFNENYVESDKYPKATYKGKITNLSSINFTKNGVYNAESEGEMTIHGITKPVKATGTIEVKDDKLIIKSKFNLDPKEYGITIPGVVQQKIADQLEINVDAAYDKNN
jgi:polyisoprenoid-binding protein YceI